MAVTLTCVLMWLGRREAAKAICLRFQKGRFTEDLALDPVLYYSPHYSQLSPYGHSAITDKIQIPNYRGLTENDSRYYVLSLFWT